MIFLNTNIISKTNGLYAQQAQENLKELKTIMKNLIIKDTPKDDTVWATDKAATIKSDSSSQTVSGGNLWAQTGSYRRYSPIKEKKSKKIPTFAL